MISWPLEWSSCKNNSTCYFIFKSESLSNIQRSTISPLIFKVSLNIRWVIETRVCLLTFEWPSFSALNNLCFFSLSRFGNRRNISVNAITRLIFKPLSAFEWSKSNTSPQFSLHIFEETHINLQRATVAFLSRMHVNGSTGLFTLFLSRAALQTPII